MQRPRAISRQKIIARKEVWICLSLVALVWGVFGQTLAYDFVNYDDKTYVYGNPFVIGGITERGLVQAFADTRTGNWHPLTMISHMIDVQLYGLKAGGHHFTNVFLHTLAVLLLFILLCQTTTALWRSAFVAAIFAIHPLHVESVAWIAERKDVLSAVFFMLVLAAYVRYTHAPSVARYVTVSILFVCGLMCKPMLVTAPLILLLLDYWPLKRLIDLRSFRRLTMEKLPLIFLSIVASVITFVLQERSTGSIAQLPFIWRIENAIVSYNIYIWQIFWPANLAVFYPHPENHLALWQVALAAGFLIATTIVVLGLRKTCPYLLIGWLWYVVMLVPVIGIVEVGLQGHADRYTYLPHIGLYVAFTWLISHLSRSLPHRQQILAGAGVIVVVLLATCSWKQTSYWRNGETLWTHTLAVTKNNDIAHTNFGMLLTDRGELDEALSHFLTALDIRSSSAHRHYDLSLALIHGNVGNVLARKGQLDDAITHLRKAVEFQPDYVDAHYNLGTALFQKGDVNEALAEWQTTLSIRPTDSGAHTNMGNALVQEGLMAKAINHYKAALQLDPQSVLPLNNLAWILATCPDSSLRDGVKAVQYALKANQLTNDNPVFIRTLAAGYAETGRFENAIETAARAAQLARAQSMNSFANQLDEDVDLFRKHLPLRDTSLTNGQRKD